MGSIFDGDLMRQEIIEVEIKSGKGTKTTTVGGSGETALEMEKQNLKDRQAKLSKELSDLNDREHHRKIKSTHKFNQMPVIALVGYTNAGKSAIANLTTGATLESEDRLFQTLNTAQRQVRLPHGQLAYMLDTVGFITKLPHLLIDCFKSTLDELQTADLLVHVRDISHPQTDFQRKTVLQVMDEVGVPQSLVKERYMEVWNKVDLVTDEEWFQKKVEEEANLADYPVVLLSATSGFNKKVFMNEVSEMIARIMGKAVVKLEYPAWEHERRVKWLL